MAEPKTILVISAHSADFVWRAGGAIALHAEQGFDVHIVCLSFGERGEFAKLWRKPGAELDEVKRVRMEEATIAAGILGAKIEFWDLGDYPLRVSEEALFRLADLYRRLKPDFVLTHSAKDPYNFDHPLTTHVAQEARVIAQAHGYKPGEAVLGAPPVFCSSRISRRCANGSRRCCSTSQPSGQKRKPPSRPWRGRSTSGNITPASPCSAVSRPRETPTAP